METDSTLPKKVISIAKKNGIPTLNIDNKCKSKTETIVNDISESKNVFSPKDNPTCPTPQKIEGVRFKLVELDDDFDENLLEKLLVKKVTKELKRRGHKVEDDSDEEYEDDDIKGLPDDVEYSEDESKYYKKLTKEQQQIILKKEKQLAEYNNIDIPQRFRILNSNLSLKTKRHIIDKIDHFYSLDESNNEFHKLSSWVDSLSKIHFDNYTPSPLKNTNPVEVVDFLRNSQDILDKAVYGHEEAKDQVLQILAQWITNPNCKGNCIAIQGPMGNGKTTLVKQGIAKCLGRPFSLIALGGLTSSDYFKGHDYTYEGSKPGRIIEILMNCQTMNPIIYFDELDKISKCHKGQEIESFLCHLTDTSQNSQFHDKYFSGIDFDLSKAIFVFSYNDASKISPILLDRMIKINTEGFKTKDKIKIAEDYLVPSIIKDIGLKEGDITFNCIEWIISTYASKEKGVRNLKRILENIIKKINILRYITLAKSVSSKDNKKSILDSDIKIEYPVTINDELCKKLIKNNTRFNDVIKSMYL